MKPSGVVDTFGMIIIVAGIMILVRPGSQGPGLVQAVGNAYQGMLTVATGSGIPAGYTPSGWFQRAA